MNGGSTKEELVDYSFGETDDSFLKKNDLDYRLLLKDFLCSDAPADEITVGELLKKMLYSMDDKNFDNLLVRIQCSRDYNEEWLIGSVHHHHEWTFIYQKKCVKILLRLMDEI